MAVYRFNFRGTIGGATDDAESTYVLGETSPQTRNGITFYWPNFPTGAGADRSATGDDRLKGINYLTPGNAGTFRITLPTTGQKDVRVAIGDPWYSSWSGLTVSFYDNNTLLSTIGPAAPAFGDVIDANGNEFSTSTWPTSNTSVRLTFATTTMNVTLAAGGGQYATIAHLEIADVGGAGASVTPRSIRGNQAVQRAANW